MISNEELRTRIRFHRMLVDQLERVGSTYFHSPRDQDSQFRTLVQTQRELAETYEELLELRIQTTNPHTRPQATPLGTCNLMSNPHQQMMSCRGWVPLTTAANEVQSPKGEV